MKTFIVIALLVGGVLLMWAASAHSQSMSFCGQHDSFVKKLADKYQEAKSGAGIAGEFALIEHYKTKSGSTWTILATDPSGKACIIAAGKDWIDFAVTPAGDDL